jgi:Sjoegren syndrome nuclear autoantigen 1
MHLLLNRQGATLQNYNNELVKCIEDLREKREEVNRQILKEEEEKAKIQKVGCSIVVPD